MAHRTPHLPGRRTSGHPIPEPVGRGRGIPVLAVPMNFCTANDRDAGKRLDHYLLEKLPQYSRSRLQSWIKDARVLVNVAAAKPSLILRGGEPIEVSSAHLPHLPALPASL